MTGSLLRRAIPPILPAVLLALVSMALYLPTLGAKFAWDSSTQVLTDPFIHDPGHLPAVLSLRVLGMDVVDCNRPTHLLWLMADAALWGKNPFGYHLTSVLLHGAVVVALFWFTRRLAPTGCAFAVALLYAAHPVNCEAVAEVGYREDLLAALFVLAGLNCAAAFGATWQGGAGAALCFLLAIGAKESAVVGPVVLALYWWWFRREEPRGPWLAWIAVALLVVGGFLAARFALAPEHSTIFTDKPSRLAGTMAGTLRVQPRIWAFYLRQIVWPADLCADYGPYSIRNFHPVASRLLVLAVIATQVFVAWRNRVFALGAAAFWLGLLPVANLVPIYHPLADRYLYLPLIGAAWMLAPFLARHRLAPWLAALAALPLAVGTFQYEKVWHDELSLWQAAERTNPFSYLARTNLGIALVHAGRPAEAIPVLQRAVEASRHAQAEPYAFLAIALEALGRPAEADKAFTEAVALDPRYAHPDLLVQALVCDRPSAEKLKVIAARN
jgi:hypothetical protein